MPTGVVDGGVTGELEVSTADGNPPVGVLVGPLGELDGPPEVLAPLGEVIMPLGEEVVPTGEVVVPLGPAKEAVGEMLVVLESLTALLAPAVGSTELFGEA